jgi:hypothetical protein
MTERDRWTEEEAWNWYREQEWPVGCNYLPSTAVNPTEMWQAGSFDPETVDRELEWAADWGMNSVRVFLQYLVWKDDPAGLERRMDRFLEIADDHGISTMFVLFDDVGFSGDEPYLGPQKDPIPNTHNSQWTPSPGHERVVDRSTWPDLAEYVRDVIRRFRGDRRVFCWDTYNEPGNSKMDEKSNPLLRESFTWAREADPVHPITAGVNWDPNRIEQNRIGSEEADVVSFHDYSDFAFTRHRVESLQEEWGRPLLCTEWLARTRDNLAETHLPYFKREGIGCYTWGFVNGKLQTHLPWSTAQTSIAEAVEDEDTDTWFHDLVHDDGTPYRRGEYETFQRYVVRDEPAPDLERLVELAPDVDREAVDADTGESRDDQPGPYHG